MERMRPWSILESFLVQLLEKIRIDMAKLHKNQKLGAKLAG